MTLFVVDIDGTLANAHHRRHLIEQEKPDWVAFQDPALLALDTPQPHAREVLDQIRARLHDVCFLTGRNERLRPLTEAWLAEHMGWRKEYEPLFMRGPEFHNTAASVYKQEQLDNVFDHFGVSSHWVTPVFFFEDDRFVARMYRKYGIVFKAPECWENLNLFGDTNEEEPIWNF